MKNVLVDSLSRLAKKYYDDLKAGGVECRLVIPGPTETIAANLQAKLVECGLPSYLVVPHSIHPDEQLRWIRAEAVTSVRQGDMVVVVWPGEMSRIQDSVIGAGGAIRNFAFGDEWPWIDSGNEYFRFIGPVTDELYHDWKIAPTNMDAFSVIIEASMRDCQDSLQRGAVFLDDFISRFDPNPTSQITNQVDALLFQLGIPLDSGILWSDDNSVRRYFDDVRHVTGALVKRVKVLGGKQELLERIDEIESDPAEAARMSSALDVMIDRISIGGDTVQIGLLTLYGCWHEEAAWKSLKLPVLRKILNIAPRDESVILEVAVSAIPGIVASEGKAVVLVENGTINFRGKFSGLNAAASGAELFIRDRAASPYLRQACTGSGVFDFDLSFDQVFGTGSAARKIIKVVIARGANELASARIPVFRCDGSRPFVVVFDPFSKVLVGRESNLEAEVDEAEIIEVKEATNVNLVVWDPSAPPKVELDDRAVELVVSSSGPNVFTLGHPIDPGLEGSGRARLTLQGGTHHLAIDFEAKDIVRGEFTLERELLVKLSEICEQPNRPAIKKLVDIFAGTKASAFPGLGGIDELSRSRISFARAFERDAAGRPLITNILRHRFDGPIHEGPMVQCHLDELPNAFRDQVVSSEVSELLASYTVARIAVKTVLSKEYPDHSPWPIYAQMPIFICANQAEIQRLLCDYLESYLQLITYASRATDQTWIERFILTCSDCVVHWDDKNEGQRLLLIGPWHPIVLAKRYMVQSALFKSALRHVTRSDTERTHVLVRLLDQVSALRWFAVPAPDGETYESFYTCASSDPGWLVAFQHQIVGGSVYAEFVRALRQLHGLDTNLMLGGGDNVARTYLQDFFNAYPTRRAISVLADSSYSTSHLVSSAQSLLFDGDVVTSVGRQLPGGIHLGVSNDDGLQTLEWKKPVICVYRVNGGSRSTDEFSDIELVSPGRAETSKDRDHDVPLPRGLGEMAAFTSPLKQVGELSSGELTSRAFERDRDLTLGAETDMGTLFSDSCRVLANLPAERLAMNWRASIPASLDRLWTIVPGNHIDPAVFVSYVTTAVSRGKNAALWDYSMSLTGTLNSYFVLSQIPESISHELNKSPVLSGQPLAPAVLGELGRVGMALGSESLRSGSKALGVIGVVAAVRLFFPRSSPITPIRNSGKLRGFLLPVDSFRDILGEMLDGSEAGQRQRADLVAVQVGLVGEGTVAISCAAIECKYTSGVLDHEQVMGATHQAASTLRRIETLITIAQQDDGVPERLALAALISFGLRLSLEQTQGKGLDRLTIDGQILQCVLDGKLSKIPAKAGKVVIATECGASRASWAQSDGLVIKVCENHWPGVSESKELGNVRERVAQEFEPLFSLVNNVEIGGGSPTAKVESAQAIVHQIAPPEPIEAEQQNNSREAPTNTTTAVETQDTDSNKKKSTALKPILLGSASGSPVYFDPQNLTRPLDNNNIMVTGSSGKGKTQFIKAFSAHLRQQDRNVLMIDFKNDFAGDLHFTQSLGLTCSHVSFDGLPFNPLIPVPLRKPNSDVEYISISEHINGLVDIFRRTFGLGDQQEVAVKNAIRESFEERGIPPRGTVKYDQALEFPDFNDVGDRLRESNSAAYNRLDPLFDLGIFPGRVRHIRFDSILNFSSVIDISQIQNDRIKNAVAKILVISAHRYYNARPHSGLLKQFFIFDEAHRILDTEFVLQFVRECRAYGVGVLLSSQYPSDFPADISSSLNTKVIHGNGPERDRVKEISRTVGNLVPEEQIAGLGMFQAIIASPQYSGVTINTLSYPMLLVLLALGKEAHPIETLVVPGIDPTRLDVGHLVDLLMRMGLAELVTGGYRAKSLDE